MAFEYEKGISKRKFASMGALDPKDEKTEKSTKKSTSHYIRAVRSQLGDWIRAVNKDMPAALASWKRNDSAAIDIMRQFGAALTATAQRLNSLPKSRFSESDQATLWGHASGRPLGAIKGFLLLAERIEEGFDRDHLLEMDVAYEYDKKKAVWDSESFAEYTSRDVIRHAIVLWRNLFYFTEKPTRLTKKLNATESKSFYSNDSVRKLWEGQASELALESMRHVEILDADGNLAFFAAPSSLISDTLKRTEGKGKVRGNWAFVNQHAFDERTKKTGQAITFLEKLTASQREELAKYLHGAPGASLVDMAKAIGTKLNELDWRLPAWAFENKVRRHETIGYELTREQEKRARKLIKDGDMSLTDAVRQIESEEGMGITYSPNASSEETERLADLVMFDSLSAIFDSTLD